MKKRISLLLLLALLSLTGAVAQSVSKQINDVKRSDKYLSAEATMETNEKAYELAQELLSKQIEEYVAGQKELKKAPNVIVKDVAGKAEQLKMNRGEMVRVFLYVKKSDIQAANNTQILVQPGNATTEKKETKKETKKGKTTSVPEAVVTQLLAQASSGSVQRSAATDVAPWQQAIVDEVLECSSATQVQQTLGNLRSRMKVKRYGTPDTCRKPAEAFWVILSADGQVQTVLGPATDSSRTNFRTGESDSLDNYKGLGAIWFTL